MIIMKTVNLCLLGDSISYGAWDVSGGWVDRLRSYLHGITLASRFQSYYFAYHLGIPGDTTGDVLARLGYETEAREPHVIVLAVGINDARWRVPEQIPHVDEAVFRRNIETLITEGRRFTQSLVFVGLTSVDESKTMPFEPNCYFENERIRRYDTIIRELTAAAGVLYLSAYDALSPAEDLEDGLHPNARGHEKLFLLVRDFLLQYNLI